MSPRPLLLLLCLGLAACGDHPLHRMQAQPSYRPFQEAPAEVGGQAMRVPPADTVPREWRALPMPLRTGQADAGYVTSFPLPLSRELLTRGQYQFEVVCAACHGLLGNGVSIMAKNASQRPPPSLHTVADSRPGRLFDVVTRGYGLMPGYASLTLEDRWAVVAYVKALQRSQRFGAAELPPDVRARLEEEAPR